MQCVSTTSSSILINGSPYGFFKSQKGVRQGDPLPPFLFVLVAEVLARLIEREAYSNGIKGFKLARDLMPITHLQFADDLFIFAFDNEENLEKIKYCLETFFECSGQKVNFTKLVIIFSKNTPHSLKTCLANSIGINALNRKEKYLGIPIISSRNKKAAVEEVIEKVRQRLQGWKMKTLSQASRTTLIPLVASSIPVYQASSLILPAQVCSKLDANNQKFSRGNIEENKQVCCLKS